MTTTSEQRTLAVRMQEGRIPVAEALQTAMRLAEALRQLHDTGKAHGAVTPASIVLSGNTVELIPTVGPLAAATPYTAPELLQGQPADARSDIFSFGALVFEMLTGRPAFEGAGQTELKLALCNATPPSSGSPAVDRLVAACVAKSPAARWQRMQKIIMELKLLTVAARRADTPAPARGAADNALRAELHQLEARVSLKFASYEKTLAGMQQTAGEAAEQLKQQLAGVHAQLVAVEQRPVVAPVDTEALMQKIQGRVQEAIAAVTQQIESHVRESVEASGQKHSAQVQEIAEQVKSAHSQQAALAEQVKQSVDAAHSEQVAHVHETVGALRQEIAEQLNGTHSQQAAHVQEAVGALRQEIAEQVKQSVDAAHSEQAAHVQETIGALRQEIAEQVKQSVDAAHSEQAAHVQEAVGALRQEIAEQVKQSVDAAHSEQSAHVHETVGALRQEIAEQLNGTHSQQAAHVQETVGALRQEIAEQLDGTHSQQAAHVQETIGALWQEIAEQVQAGHSQQAAHVQETVGTLRQEIAEQVKQTVESAQEQHASQIQETLGSVKQEIAEQVKHTVESSLAQHAAQVQETLAASAQQHSARVQESIAAGAEQASATVSAVNERMAAAEANMEEIRKHFATLQSNVAGDLHDFEKSLKAQGVAIESARTAMAQTDDLVERVVEALELMQSSIIDQHEPAGVN